MYLFAESWEIKLPFMYEFRTFFISNEAENPAVSPLATTTSGRAVLGRQPVIVANKHTHKN